VVKNDVSAGTTYIALKVLVKFISAFSGLKVAEPILDVILMILEQNGIIEKNAYLQNQVDIKVSIKETYRILTEQLPTNKAELIGRAWSEIEPLLANLDTKKPLSDELCKKIYDAISRDSNLEAEILTNNDLNGLVFLLADTLEKNMDAAIIALDKISEVKEDVKNIHKEIEKLKDDVKEIKNNQQKENAMHNDNQLYANNYKEILFLHRDVGGVSLEKLFVTHEYRENDEQGSDVLERIKGFIDDDRWGCPNFMFIEGSAGLGKSSLVSHLAHLHENEDERNILGGRKLVCVRLRDIIADFNKDSMNSSILKYINIKNARQFQEMHNGSIVILDGFDELCMIEGISNKVSGYIHDLYDLLSDCKVILTTRPQYLDVPKVDFAKAHIELMHFGKNKRSEWVEKYIVATENNPDEKVAFDYISNIEDDEAAGICDTPMALYMIAAGRINEDAVKNPWAMFHQIFYKEISETAYNAPDADGKKRHPISELNKEHIYRLGAEIAFEMFKSGNEKLFLTKNEIMNLVDTLGIEKANVKEVVKHCHALCSYWKRNNANGAVEFYHNNIRDFFMCEKIFYEMWDIYEENADSDWAASGEVRQRLYNLLYHSRLNVKTAEFLHYRILREKELDEKDNFAKLEQLQKRLPSITEGFLLDDKEPVAVNRGWEIAYNLIINVLANIMRIYRYVYEPYLSEGEAIKWINSNPYDLSLVSKNFNEIFFNRLYDETIIYTAGKFDFGCMDLADANLSFVDFADCRFCVANFGGAALYRVDFEKADLQNANFGFSSLRGVGLSGCDLRICDFLFASLNDVDLFGSDIRGCNFTYATFFQVTLPDGKFVKNTAEAIAHLKSLNIEGLKFSDEPDISH